MPVLVVKGESCPDGRGGKFWMAAGDVLNRQPQSVMPERHVCNANTRPAQVRAASAYP